MAWLIYMHTCKVNDKKYIGLTKCATTARWKNGRGYSKQSLFANAINKFGWENFEHTILETDIQTETEANEREAYWIAFYNTCATTGGWGYNLLPKSDVIANPRIYIKRNEEVLKIYLFELNEYEPLGWQRMTKQEVSHMYYLNHKESLAEYSKIYGKQYKAEHKEEIAAKNKQYAIDHKDKVKAKQQEWINNNKEHIAAQQAAWNEANKEYLQEKSKNYYLEHREEILEKQKKYAIEHKEKIAAYKKQYRAEHKEEIAEYKKNYKKRKAEVLKNDEDQSG